MTARLLALLAVVAVAPAGAPFSDAVAAEKAKRTPACKTKKASKQAAKQRKGKRRCRPQARHLRSRPAARKPSAATPLAPSTPGAAPATPLGGPALPGADPPAAPADPTCGASRHLGATAEDADGFRLRLTRTCVPAGEVTVNWQNTDASEHDLWARPLAGTGGTVQQIIAATLTTELPVFAVVTLSPGRWELFCSLSGHGAMRASVTVTP